MPFATHALTAAAAASLAWIVARRRAGDRFFEAWQKGVNAGATINTAEPAAPTMGCLAA